MDEKENEVKPKDLNFDVWKCECAPEKEFDKAGMVAHLKEVHKVEDLKGKGGMKMHLDARDWFQSDYEYTVGGVVIYRSVRIMRNKHTRMY